MVIQNIIIGIIIAGAVLAAARYFYNEVNQNIKCKNYGCAGCALYDKCKKNKKKVTK